MSRFIYKKWLLAIVTLMIGFNLRPIMASVSPIIPVLQNAIGMTNQAAGLLTTLPVAMMGCFALLGARLQSKVGEYEGVVFGLLAIVISCSARLLTYSTLLLIITSIIGGMGIAIIQTLMPAYLKRVATDNASIYMGLFTTGIMGGAAIAATISSPLEAVFGWNFALSVMAMPALFAIALCFFGMQRLTTTDKGYLSLPFKSKNAWLLMLFFGIGTGAYTLVLAWLPLNYIQLGWSRNASGALLGALTVAEVGAGLLVSLFITRFPDRRKPLFGVLLFILVGLLLMVYMPSQLPLLTVVILGVGIGGLFPLSLIVALDYALNAKQAVSLLAFVQGGGYLIASIFPLMAGALIDASSDLTNAWIAMLFGVVLLLGICMKFSPKGFSIQF
ncbi:MFS transporter [Psychrobacter sp. B38]|uniref:MFS transporter n=1 Tax=Psychrobacter sp. B38 TaxID=3143538 RepID=UPI00320C1183